MRDPLDMQTNDFLENGTRSDCIHPRTFMGAVDTPRFDNLIGRIKSLPAELTAIEVTINMDDWESHPVTSIFDCSDDVAGLEPEEPRAVSKAIESRRKESRSINDFCKAVLSVRGEEV